MDDNFSRSFLGFTIEDLESLLYFILVPPTCPFVHVHPQSEADFMFQPTALPAYPM